MEATPQEIADLLRMCPTLGYKNIALTGASGSGKTTILVKDQYSVQNLKPDYFDFSRSAATREPRKNENHGKDYLFFSENLFKNQKYLETNEYAGNNKLYGTLLAEARRIMSRRKSMLLDIDINGGKKLKGIFKEDLFWGFLDVPENDLFARLKGRQEETGESDAQIEGRILAARQEKELIHSKTFIPDAIIPYPNAVRPAEIANELLVRCAKIVHS